jgi:multicomponent Na+:H+ antiporter subunit F
VNVVFDIAQWMVAAAAVACVARVVMGPSLADRVIALDTLLICIAVEVALAAARSGDGRYLDLLVVVALVAFIGSVAVGRFIERRGARPAQREADA